MHARHEARGRHWYLPYFLSRISQWANSMQFHQRWLASCKLLGPTCFFPSVLVLQVWRPCLDFYWVLELSYSCFQRKCYYTLHIHSAPWGHFHTTTECTCWNNIFINALKFSCSAFRTYSHSLPQLLQRKRHETSAKFRVLPRACCNLSMALQALQAY